MDLNDVYRKFHLKTAQYIFFSAAHGTFSKMDHILGQKVSLSKCKKTEITPCILSRIQQQNNTRKYANNWLNNTLLNDQWVIKEIREEIKRFLKANENENTTTRTYETQQRQS
jgi:hypothetical protein